MAAAVALTPDGENSLYAKARDVAAMTALIPVVADERCYQKVLPRIGELIRTNQRAALTPGLMKPMRDKIKLADPKVHELAVETLRESYTQYAGAPTAPGGLDVSRTIDSHLEYIATSLADVPGGMDALFEITQQRYQALRTQTKTIDGTEYLFVESGNFNRREQHGTDVMWQVFSR